MNAPTLTLKLIELFFNPLLALLFAAAVLVFIWGLVQFLLGLSGGSQSKEEGKMHMLWGIIGLFIMTAAYTLIQIAVNTIGADVPTI